jgi:hypothetical protein
MRKFITKSLEMLSLVLMALFVLGSAFAGGSGGGFTGFVIGAIGGAVMSIVIFGALFVLMDIADNTRRTAELLEQQK